MRTIQVNKITYDELQRATLYLPDAPAIYASEVERLLGSELYEIIKHDPGTVVEKFEGLEKPRLKP